MADWNCLFGPACCEVTSSFCPPIYETSWFDDFSGTLLDPGYFQEHINWEIDSGRVRGDSQGSFGLFTIGGLTRQAQWSYPGLKTYEFSLDLFWNGNRSASTGMTGLGTAFGQSSFFFPNFYLQAGGSPHSYYLVTPNVGIVAPTTEHDHILFRSTALRHVVINETLIELEISHELVINGNLVFARPSTIEVIQKTILCNFYYGIFGFVSEQGNFTIFLDNFSLNEF